MIFVNALASVLLAVLAEPIVRLLFERGEFTADSTSRAALALACLSPGLVAFSMVNILARAFYALGDTQTPMRISLVCLALNLVFALWLISPLRQGGLGIANSLSAVFNVGLLLYALRRKLQVLELAALRQNLPRILAATLLAGMAAWWLASGWERWIGHGGLWQKIGAVFAPGAAAALLYAGLALWLQVPQAKEIAGLLRQKFRR